MNGPLPSARDVALRASLEALLSSTDALARRANDPVSAVHRFRDPADQEVVGLVAALLAFGNAKAIRQKLGTLLERLGPSPSERITSRAPAALARDLEDIRHRIYRGRDIARLLSAASDVRRQRGSLGQAFRDHVREGRDLRETLALFCDDLRAAAPAGPRRSAFRHLLPDPRAGSPCKRLNLYLRWMVRRADGVDLGLWPVSPALLIVPLDTHVFRISRNLGLTKRRSPSWRTAEAITARLRRFDPEDPVRYDFALCHLGIARDCPSRRDPVKCARCVLKDVCLRWVS